MDKYSLIAFINTLQLILILGIIICSAMFSWSLLLLLLFVGTSDFEDKILGSKK